MLSFYARVCNTSFIKSVYPRHAFLLKVNKCWGTDKHALNYAHKDKGLAEVLLRLFVIQICVWHLLLGVAILNDVHQYQDQYSCGITNGKPNQLIVFGKDLHAGAWFKSFFDGNPVLSILLPLDHQHWASLIDWMGCEVHHWDSNNKWYPWVC